MDAINLKPARLALNLYQGDTPDFTMDLPFDLTGGTARMQIRLCQNPDPAVLTLESGAGLTVAFNSPEVGKTRITMRALTDAEENQIQMAVGGAEYDLQTTLTGKVKTWLRGSVTISSDVTRGTP